MSDWDHLSASVRFRNRSRGARMRFEHPDDCRAFLYRLVSRLAPLEDDDADLLCEALWSMAENNDPPRLEELLGIPETWPGKARDRRNETLRKIARELCLPMQRSSAAEVHRCWVAFFDRVYRRWAEDGEVPEGAARLNELLFLATRFNGGAVLGERQIWNILSPSD